MNEAEEIQRLRQEIKELRYILALKETFGKEVGRARIRLRTYGGCRNDEWQLAVKKECHTEFWKTKRIQSKDAWVTIQTGDTRADAIAGVDGIIDSLAELKRQLQE